MLIHRKVVPNPGAEIAANSLVKLVACAVANPSPSPRLRLIGTDVIHVSASIRRILIHAAGKYKYRCIVK